MLDLHNTQFNALDSLKENAEAVLKRKRGLDFEKLINDVCDSEDILLQGGYHTDDNRAEQIDGAIEINHRIFLLEVKWVEANLAASDLYSFIGKVENKFQGTGGIFISRNALTENFIHALNKGRRQSVIVIHGPDLDDIFTHKVSLKNYLHQAIRVMSYNNIAHYPVKDYLESIKPQLDIQKDLDHNVAAVAFIQKNFLKGKFGRNDLLELTKGPTDALDIVFTYAVNRFGTLYKDALSKLEFERIRHVETFLRTYTPSEKIYLAAAESYYSRLVIKAPRLYIRQEFLDRFHRYYPKISQDARDTFEKEIVRVFSGQRGDWDMENHLTILVETLWPQFKQQTRDELAEIYLDFYVDSSRQSGFPQKQFAAELVTGDRIPRDVITAWLYSKLIKAKESYDKVTPESITFIETVYLPVAQYLRMDVDRWRKTVEDVMN
jgi:hypothetical protein